MLLPSDTCSDGEMAAALSIVWQRDLAWLLSGSIVDESISTVSAYSVLNTFLLSDFGVLAPL